MGFKIKEAKFSLMFWIRFVIIDTKGTVEIL